MSTPSTSTPTLPQPSNPVELEQTLLLLTHNDTTKIQQATAVLKEFLTKPASLQALMQQVSSSTRQEARQLACILLRSKINKHFKKLSPEQQDAIKATLLQRFVDDPSRVVRRAVAALISTLAKKQVPGGKWNQLLQLLLTCSKSPEASQRALSMLLFRALAENIGKALKPHFHTLLEIFQRGLLDENEEVRLEAMKALNVLVEFLEVEKEVVAFRQVIPPLVNMVQKAVDEKKDGSDEAAALAFEILDNVAALPVDVLMQHVGLLVGFMVRMCLKEDLEVNIREKSSGLISAFIAHKPGKLVKGNLVQPILKCALSLVTEEFEEVFEAEEMTPQKMGVEILDAVIMNIPRRVSFEPIMSQASALLKHTEARFRKGGYVTLAVMAEGFCELLKPNMTEILQAICAGTRDGTSMVRIAAIVALTQWADYLQPEIIECHKLVIPHLLMALDNTEETATVKMKACVALDVFCEQLAEKILPYMDDLMRRFVGLASSSKDLKVVAQAVNGMKSVAGAAGTSFLKYLDPTLKMLKTMVDTEVEERLALRCAATECVGEVAHAVGKEHFKPYFQVFLNLATKGMNSDTFELREKTYSFFANIAQMLEEEIEPLLETVIPFCVASCMSEDGLQFQVDENELDAEGNIVGIDNDDEEEEKETTNLGVKRLKYKIRSGALDEKIAAIQCMNTIIEHAGSCVIPYLPRVSKSLSELIEYPHPLIRAAVTRCYGELLGAMYRHFCKDKPIKAKGLPKECQNMLKQVYPLMLQRLVEEEDKETCACACDVFAETGKLFGISALEPYIKPLVDATLMLLKEKAPCQNNPEEDENVTGDHDEVLIDAVTDLISALAEICGQKFDGLFRQFLPHLLKFNTPARSYSDRAMAIGCLAECSEHMNEILIPHLPVLFPVFIKALADPHWGVRRNAAFAVGVLCKHGGPAASKFYQPALIGLKPLFESDKKSSSTSSGSSDSEDVKQSRLDAKMEEKEEKEHRPAAKDNACSAVGKMIAAGANALPLADVVKLFLSGLPLKSDFAEAKHVYPTMLNLFKTHPRVIGASIPAVLLICAQVFGTDEIKVSKEIQAHLLQLCNALIKTNGKDVQTIVSQFPPPLRDNFLKFIASHPPTPSSESSSSTSSSSSS